MDKLFSSHWFVKFVSVVIAVMLYMMVNTNSLSNQPSMFSNQEESTHTLTDVEVEVIYDDEQYAVVNMEETVNVKLTGTQTSIMLFQLSRPSYEVYVDLEDRGEGVHNVPIEHRNFPTDLQVSITPSYMSVELQELEEVSYSVETELKNRKEAADGYTFGTPKTKPSEVVVTAPRAVHQQMGSVKAFVDVAGVDERIETEAEVFAYDKNGTLLEYPIEPETVQVTVPVTEPFKKVPINLSREGNLPNDLSITSLNMNPTEVTVYGDLDILEDIHAVEAVIDVTEIDNDDVIELNVNPPEGVTRIHPETVEVEIEVGERDSLTIEDVPITLENVPEHYSVEWTNPENGRMDMIVHGAKNILDSLDLDEISLFVDWEDRDSEGDEETFPVRARGPAEIRIEPEMEHIQLTWTTEE